MAASTYTLLVLRSLRALVVLFVSWLACFTAATLANADAQTSAQRTCLSKLGSASAKHAASQGKADHDFCKHLCQFLAGEMHGVFQADGMGFFDAAGELLAWEDE